MMGGGVLMLFRKIESLIEEHLKSDTKKILLIDGARQVGKTYIIRYVGEKLFENFIEINMVEDSLGDRLFAETKTVEDFYLQVSMLKGEKMKEKENTLIFIDEIQAYPHLLTLLKFLSQDNKFTYIASGSLLGVTLSQTTSIPMGSIRKVRMYPLDFEEFLYANGLNELALSSMRKKFEHLESLDEPMHNKMMDLFRKYLLIGGLPDAVNAYLETKNIKAVREIQTETHSYYAADAAKYDEKNKLKIRRIYDLLPSNMENKKKRVVAKSIEDKKGKTFNDYVDDLAAFWQQEVQPGPWRKRYILAHSMGGAISTLFLQRHPGVCDAIALTAPMFGIVIRMPSFMARQILNWAEAHPRFRDGYAIGTGRWRALPFAINVLTHSRQRYRRNLRFYADDPTIRVGGPTYHWVRESILAGEQVLAGAGDDATPTLLLQAEEERVVDNRMHDRFCELRTAAGHPVEGGRPLVIKGAYHEILFEKDAMRSVALHAIVDFFNRHNSPSGNRSTEV